MKNRDDIKYLFIGIGVMVFVLTIGLSVASCLNCSEAEVNLRVLQISISTIVAFGSFLTFGIIHFFSLHSQTKVKDNEK